MTKFQLLKYKKISKDFKKFVLEIKSIQNLVIKRKCLDQIVAWLIINVGFSVWGDDIISEYNYTVLIF